MLEESAFFEILVTFLGDQNIFYRGFLRSRYLKGCSGVVWQGESDENPSFSLLIQTWNNTRKGECPSGIFLSNGFMAYCPNALKYVIYYHTLLSTYTNTISLAFSPLAHAIPDPDFPFPQCFHFPSSSNLASLINLTDQCMWNSLRGITHSSWNIYKVVLWFQKTQTGKSTLRKPGDLFAFHAVNIWIKNTVLFRKQKTQSTE